MELRNDKGLVEEWDGMDNTLEHSMDIPSPSSEVSRSPINGMVSSSREQSWTHQRENANKWSYSETKVRWFEAHLREKKMNGSSLSVSSESRSRSRLGRLFKASRKHKTMDWFVCPPSFPPLGFCPLPLLQIVYCTIHILPQTRYPYLRSNRLSLILSYPRTSPVSP